MASSERRFISFHTQPERSHIWGETMFRFPVQAASVVVLLLVRSVLLLPTTFAQPDSRVLFHDDFERGLGKWEVIGEDAVAVQNSVDPGHRSVLVLSPNGDAAALIRDSQAWGSVRLEGEMMFPSAVDNYLGFLYNFTTRGSRRDFGLIYVKGNESYLQVNPHRDFNVSRLIYPEFHVPLTGTSAVVTGQWQRFALEVAGATAHVYVGDTTIPQLTFSYLELDHGALGLQPRSVGGPVWVDNVTVRSISRLSYSGAPIPEPTYAPDALLVDWQVTGPFEHTEDRFARQPASATWMRFSVDARGAVVTGRAVDYHGRRTVAYFRTTVQSLREQSGELQLSTGDDLAVWVNGRFASFVARQDAAWHDFHSNKVHAGRRIPLSLRAGSNDVVVRVRGGVYATGGFFARIVKQDGGNDATSATDGPSGR